MFVIVVDEPDPRCWERSGRQPPRPPIGDHPIVRRATNVGDTRARAAGAAARRRKIDI
jgi:hypothetical protein